MDCMTYNEIDNIKKIIVLRNIEWPNKLIRGILHDSVS